MSVAPGPSAGLAPLRAARSMDDQALADAILADAESRTARDEPVTLDVYLTEIPGLAQRTVPLDAAIEAVIVSATRSGTPVARAIDALLAEHPEFADQIRDCAVLTSALCATHDIEQLFSESRTLPSEFGPVLENGATRYVLLRALGVGSSGTVYEAEDRVLSDGPARALVALKVLTRAEGRFAEIHWQEAAKANRVKHPNVVRALDRGTAPSGEQYAVFELVDGGDLDSFATEHGPLHPLDAALLLAQTARGVHASHQAGLIHADLKPQNVLLTKDRAPKIADFGIARRHDDPLASTRPTGRFGGLAFMAPEQFRDAWEGATIAADVYALGGLLFWLLTGTLPNGESREEIESVLTNDDAPVWRDTILKRHRVPRTLRAIILRAIAFDPDLRHDSAAELADELTRFIDRRPVQSAKPSLVTRGALWASRHPTASVGVVCLAMTLVGGAVVGVNAWRLSAEEARQHRAIETARSLQTLATLRDGGKFETESLMYLWALEWIGQAGLFPDYETWATTATTERMQIIRGYIADAETRGQTDSIETHLWRIALANFMLNEKDPHPDAAPLLDDAIAGLEQTLAPQDELLLQARAMRRVAVVKHHFHDTENGARLTPEVTAELRRLADELKSDLDRLREARPGSPIFLLVLRALDNVYRGKMLDDSEARTPFLAERKAFKQK